MERKTPQGNLHFHKNTQIMGFGLAKNVFGIKMGVPSPYDMDTFLHDISAGYFINKIGILNYLFNKGWRPCALIGELMLKKRNHKSIQSQRRQK